MSAAKPKRYDALDSLRGLCACLVALFHFKTTGNITNSAFIRESWLFVDFFFVLSGFVIMAGYGERLKTGYSTTKFMILRMGRIYPLHFAVLMVFVGFELVKLALGGSGADIAPFTSPRSPMELLQSLTLTQVFGFGDTIVWNGPSWSIAAEMWTYLIAAILLGVFGKRADIVTGLVVLASLAWLALTGDGGLDRTFSGALVRCIYGFGLGMLAYRLLSARPDRGAAISPVVGTLLESAVVLGIIAYLLIMPSVAATLAAPVFFVIAVYVFALEAGWISRFLKIRVMLFLGMLSYSIYMVHIFVEARVIDVALLLTSKLGLPLASRDAAGTKFLGTADAPWFADLLAMGGLLAIIAVSYVSYRLVEEPFRLMSRKLVNRPRPKSQTP